MKLTALLIGVTTASPRTPRYVPVRMNPRPLSCSRTSIGVSISAFTQSTTSLTDQPAGNSVLPHPVPARWPPCGFEPLHCPLATSRAIRPDSAGPTSPSSTDMASSASNSPISLRRTSGIVPSNIGNSSGVFGPSMPLTRFPGRLSPCGSTGCLRYEVPRYPTARRSVGLTRPRTRSYRQSPSWIPWRSTSGPPRGSSRRSRPAARSRFRPA